VYPPLSRRLGEQGRVLLNLYILADGSLGQVVLKQSSGYRRLDDAAITAVKAWKFIPAHQNGAVVAAWYLQNVAFSLRDTP
jgi:protein TonB